MSEPEARPPGSIHEDVLGPMPYLLGYHPADCLIAVGVSSRRRTMVVGIDLTAAPTTMIEKLGAATDRYRPSTVVLIGYGQSCHAAVAAVGDSLQRRYRVARLVVANGSYFCVTPGCGCPATAGVAFDPRATSSAAGAAVHGHVAMPSRQDLLALVAPDPRAQQSVAAILTARTGATADAAAAGTSAVRATVADLMVAAQRGHRLSDEQVADLAAALLHRPARDYAWLATGDRMWQRDLWLDVTRRVPLSHAAAPACLAAWTSWLRGDGILAQAAARRALTIDPDDGLAHVVAAGVRGGVAAADLVGMWPLQIVGRRHSAG